MKFYSLILILFLVGCNSNQKKDKKPLKKNNVPTVKQINTPVLANSSLPRLVSNDSTLFLSWVEKQDSLSLLKYASYKHNKWSQPTTVAAGTDWFINWADFPVIAENNKTILTSFLQKSATGTYTYDVKLNLLNPSSNIKKNNFLLNTDGTQSEHGFVSMIPYNDDFFVTWLDGRNTVNVPREKAQMTLRGAIVTSNGEIRQDTMLDERTCDCCNTATARTSAGPVVVYRDRSPDEIRDIYIVRNVNGKWTSPQVVVEDNWHIPGCPVNGPAIDAINDNLAVVWFTAANDNPQVQIAFSNDGGATFGLPVRMDKGDAIGRVDVVLLDADTAAVLWMEPKGEETVIQLAKVTALGDVRTPITISKTKSERASGFPQLEKVGSTLYVAWTSLEKEQTINMVAVPVSAL